VHEPTRKLVDDFYGAFARRDGDAMAALYAKDVHFHDPVFLDLHGDQARAMWKMLCGRAKDLRVTHEVLDASETSARARWIANYTFSTGRAVENRIEASMEIGGGLITRHTDRFDLYRWARQALGPMGVVLGWSPLVQGRIRRTAREGLDRFMSQSGAR
jgi:ketosteroid isomerase-like protein